MTKSDQACGRLTCHLESVHKECSWPTDLNQPGNYTWLTYQTSVLFIQVLTSAGSSVFFVHPIASYKQTVISNTIEVLWWKYENEYCKLIQNHLLTRHICPRLLIPIKDINWLKNIPIPGILFHFAVCRDVNWKEKISFPWNFKLICQLQSSTCIRHMCDICQSFHSFQNYTVLSSQRQ